MLTPVDIQQKKFHIGLGYDKKDVNTFFDEVAKNYEELYRSNADLKERINVLTDGLQNYKSKEDALEKSLMRAEKDSEDKKSRATREAKNIELDAKNKAKVIIGDAEERLTEIKEQMALLETQYAAYKANFCNLMKKQFEYLKEDDFDADSYIDEKALGVLIGGTVAASGSSSGDGSFGSFSGDPQMRDESSLGGMNSDYGRDNTTSTSAVYTAHLSSNENFVDPFNPNKDNGRYNPYDGSDRKRKTESGKEKSFKVASPNNKNKYKRAPVGSKTESASTPSVKHDKADSVKTSEASSANDFKPREKAKNVEADIGPIPTVALDNDIKDETINLTGEVEVNLDGISLIGYGTEPDDSTDEFGFEFV